MRAWPNIGSMQKFEGISFVWALALVALIALIYGVRAFLGYRQVARDAEEDYAFKSGEGMIDARLSREGYIRAYKRFYAPRSKAYIAAALGAVLALTAPALAVISFALEQLWIATGRDPIYQPGFFVWQFMIFFSIIGIWAATVYFIARRYYANVPVSFNQEQEKEMGKP